MKDFFKYTLATITGIIIFGLVIGTIFVISLVGMVASDSATTQVKENSVFVLKLKGLIDERATDDMGMLGLLTGNDMGTLGLDDILSAIEKAKENEDIKGIYIEAGAAEIDSPATAQRIRNALADFKKSGKWIVAYGNEYPQICYWVSSVADEIYMSPTGAIDFKGLGTKAEYDTGLLEKLGVKYQAVRVGKYKSYVESKTRKDMSPEDREQRLTYMQGIWNQMLKDIAASRKLTPEALNQLGAHQLGQEKPGHRLQLFLQQNDQQNNAEDRIQNGCASACNAEEYSGKTYKHTCSLTDRELFKSKSIYS